VDVLELDHFSYGLVTPALAYVMSVVGSVLGLRCAFHARLSRRPGVWLALGAVALGGAGIWVMHFTAMLGFTIRDTVVVYDLPMTLLSAVIAILVVWIGLSIVMRWDREALALLIGGTITGLGVAAMHYAGMYAMDTDDAHIDYTPAVVALSIVIAVAAATAALWFMLHIRGFRATIGAGAIMGAAVCGMHYTGMASMHAYHRDPTPAHGTDAMQLLLPLVVSFTLITMAVMVLVGMAEMGDQKLRGSAGPKAPAGAGQQPESPRPAVH
jgi:NO-binding membrane sensor protein with MHYT domain